MATPHSAGLVRTFRRAALVTFVLGGITFCGGSVSLPSASAHDELVSSNPQQGDELATAPESIDLTFSADILDLGAAVLVVDSTSTDRAIGVPELAGNTLTQTVADLDDGAYQVRWRVVSGDGHPIAGSFDFIVGDPASTQPITAAASAPTVEVATPDAAPANPAGPPEPSAGFWAVLPVWQYALMGAVGGLGMFALVLRLRRAADQERRHHHYFTKESP